MNAQNDEAAPLLAHDSEEVDAFNPPCVKNNHAVTPLPWGQLTILLLLNMIPPLAFELIYPFVNQVCLFSFLFSSKYLLEGAC